MHSRYGAKNKLTIGLQVETDIGSGMDVIIVVNCLKPQFFTIKLDE